MLPDERQKRQSASSLRGVRLLAKGVFPTAKMSRSTDQSITNNTETKVLFDTRDKDAGYDDGQQQSGSEICDLTNDEIVLRYPGFWAVTFFGCFAASTGGTVRGLRFFLNGGVAVGGRFAYDRVNSAVFLTTVYGTLRGQFVEGDKVDARVIQDSGVALSLVAAEGIYMSAEWIGL
jgi:hypothetical protein